MNTLQTILVAACASGGAACFLFSLAYRFRNELRKLHERWLKMSPLSRAMCILALSVAVLYGGTKPPSSTNEPPADTMDTGAMGVSPVAGWAPDGQATVNFK